MTSEILYTYDGVLTFDTLSSDRQDEIIGLMSDAGLKPTVKSGWLDFEYFGKTMVALL